MRFDTCKQRVNPESIKINGKPLEYIEPLTLLIYKPKNVISDYPFYAPMPVMQDEDGKEVEEPEHDAAEDAENDAPTPTLFNYLPPLFLRRMPGFQMPHPLPLDVAGLELLTQFGMLFACYANAQKIIFLRY